MVFGVAGDDVVVDDGGWCRWWWWWWRFVVGACCCGSVQGQFKVCCLEPLAVSLLFGGFRWLLRVAGSDASPVAHGRARKLTTALPSFALRRPTNEPRQVHVITRMYKVVSCRRPDLEAHICTCKPKQQIITLHYRYVFSSDHSRLPYHLPTSASHHVARFVYVTLPCSNRDLVFMFQPCAVLKTTQEHKAAAAEATLSLHTLAYM